MCTLCIDTNNITSIKYKRRILHEFGATQTYNIYGQIRFNVFKKNKKKNYKNKLLTNTNTREL